MSPAKDAIVSRNSLSSRLLPHSVLSSQNCFNNKFRLCAGQINRVQKRKEGLRRRQVHHIQSKQGQQEKEGEIVGEEGKEGDENPRDRPW